MVEAGKDWCLPVEVFTERYTPLNKIRRMKNRQVRNYYYALNDMIKKYLIIDKVQQQFERCMKRLEARAARGDKKKLPYTWSGTTTTTTTTTTTSSSSSSSSSSIHEERECTVAGEPPSLAAAAAAGAASSSSSSSSSSANSRHDDDDDDDDDLEKQLPNHHYYRPHEHKKDKQQKACHEKTPLLLLGSKKEGGAYSGEANYAHSDEEDEECEEENTRQAQEENNWRIKLAIHSTFWVNVLLFFLKTFASLDSLSLSVIASALDSLLDLLSGSVIFFASWIVNGRSREINFPGGTSRIEPLAVLIFAVGMFTATTQLLIRSAETLASGEPHTNIGPISMGIIAFTVVVKILLWIYCATVKNSESVEAMMIDNRNDVLTNSYGLAMIFLASRYYWWMDPLGAIGMSLYIMFIWFRTGVRNVKAMSGMSATPDFLNQLVYLAYNHHPAVVAVDTVRAYHLAYNYLVEVDIVLPETMTVMDSHDIAEALQDKIEMLENVERAWVHIDYEYSHKPEHKKNFG